MIVLAIEIFCRCPPDKFCPLSDMIVSNPNGKLSTNSVRLVALIHFIISSVKNVLPIVIFSLNVPLNRTFSCSTIPIFSLIFEYPAPSHYNYHKRLLL